MTEPFKYWAFISYSSRDKVCAQHGGPTMEL
jgi:hypothetical protein